MAIVVNMHEAKTHLSRLVEDVLAGESVVIARAGVPLVELSVYAAPRRVFGSMKDVLPDIPNDILIDSDEEELANHLKAMDEAW
jgi:antitoxin (DNA-binding transcriptional repressor) of toxin-antitoxin stability system